LLFSTILYIFVFQNSKKQNVKELKDLTPEIRSKIITYKETAIKDLYSGEEYKSHKKEDSIRYVEYVYKLGKQKNPVVIVANTIKEYKNYFNILFNEAINEECSKAIDALWLAKNEATPNEEKIAELYASLEDKIKNTKLDGVEKIEVKYHYLFLLSEYSRVYLMWYYFIMKEFNLQSSKGEELEWLYNNVRKASIAKAFVCEKIALVLRLPSKILRNDIGFHSVTEEAIQYPDQKLYYINGREIPNWVFEDYENGTLTFEKFNEQKNEDIRAGIITLIKEREGNEGLIEFLKAVVVDKQIIRYSYNIIYHENISFSFFS